MAPMNTVSARIISSRSGIHTEYISWGASLEETHVETCGIILQYYYGNQFQQKHTLNFFMITEKKCSQIIFLRVKRGMKLGQPIAVRHTKPEAMGLYHTLRI